MNLVDPRRKEIVLDADMNTRMDGEDSENIEIFRNLGGKTIQIMEVFYIL